MKKKCAPAWAEPEYVVNLQMKLADLYMANGQYTEAENILNDLPEYYGEIEQFKNLREIQIDMLQANNTIEDLNGDEIGLLDDIAESNTQAGWEAKAILIALGEDTIPFDIEDRIYASPKRGEDLTEQPKTELNMEEGVHFKVFPNPANNTITVEYTFTEEHENEAMFTLFSLMGSESLSVPLKGTQGSVIIDVSSLYNGVYLYQVVSQNKKLCQHKLVIVR